MMDVPVCVTLTLSNCWYVSTSVFFRLGLDQSLGESFNPMSTADEDIQNFRDCVYKFQKSRSLVQCQPGALCANTIEKLRHLLRTQRHTM